MSGRAQIITILVALAVALFVLVVMARNMPGTPSHLQAVTERAAQFHNNDRDAGQPR